MFTGFSVWNKPNVNSCKMLMVSSICWLVDLWAQKALRFQVSVKRTVNMVGAKGWLQPFAKWATLHITLVLNTKSIRLTFCSRLQKGFTVWGNKTRVELMSEDTSDTKVLRASRSPADPLSPHPALPCKQPCGTACSYNLLSASHTYMNGWERDLCWLIK